MRQIVRRSSSSSSGFTLVELLVVIGIIAVLISMLMPALRKARESALSVQCMSNQRQIGIAFTAYANENKGYLPPQWETSEWVNQELKDLYQHTLGKVSANVFFCPALQTHGSIINRSWGTNIPDESPEWYWANQLPWGYLLGYYYVGNLTSSGIPPEWQLGDADQDGDTREEYVIKLSDKNAAYTVILADKSGQYVPEQWSMRHPDYSRNGTLNVLTGDGHVESRQRSELLPRLNRQRWAWNKQVGW